MKRSTAALLAFAVALFLGMLRSHLFTAALYEFGDDAANALSIFRAKHFAQLYGCFSRWGFYHPGPALFYVQGWGEWLLFDFLHVCPTPRNAQLLTQFCLNVCMLITALRTFTVWLPAGPRRRWFLAGSLAFAAFHFADARADVFFRTWPANPPVLLMLCLLTTGAAVAAGLGSELPLLVLAGGFLLHSHVAQPLFVVPLTLLAYTGLLVRCATVRRAKPGFSSWGQRFKQSLGAGWRAWPCAHLLSFGLLVAFALPLVIDACRGADSNLVVIWQHLRGHQGERKPWLRSILYFLQFGIYAFYHGGTRDDFGHYDRAGMIAYLRVHTSILAFWAGVAATAIWTVIRQISGLLRQGFKVSDSAMVTPESAVGDNRCFLAWAGIFLTVVVGLTLYWGTIQDGPMFYYNAFFNYGIYYFGALITLAALCSSLRLRLPASPPRWVTLVSRFGPVGMVLFAYGLQVNHLRAVPGPPLHEAELYAHVMETIAATAPDRLVETVSPKFLIFTWEWPWSTAAALQICRTRTPFLVPPGSKVMFGEEHVWRPGMYNTLKNGAQIWRIGTSAAAVTSTPPVVSPKALALQPPIDLKVSAPVVDPAGPDGAAVVDYRKTGNALTYALFGWSEPEAWGTWSDGHLAMLAFLPQPVTGGDVRVQLEGVPFLTPASGLSAQRLQVFFDGEALGESRWLNGSPDDARSLVFVIPAALWNRSLQKYTCAVLGFEMPDAEMPAKVEPGGHSTDRRLLGLGFKSLRFSVVR